MQSPESPTVVRWSRADRADIKVHFWADDESAVAFDASSGDTFLLGPLALELLTLLNEEGPLSSGELTSLMARNLAELTPADLASNVAVELESLHTRGLLTARPT